MTTVQQLDVRGPRDVQTAKQAQALGSRRLGFSVTQACPLQCRHCSVSAAPDLAANRLSVQFAENIVRQMDDIADTGITSIDFTGGEPTLARHFVVEVSRAAQGVGITTGIVTAAHWAATERQADAFLDTFSSIDHWDISTDVYHLEFVGLDAVRRAFEKLTERGRRPLIRIAYHNDMTRADAELIGEVMSFAGRRVSFQPIGPVGRGADVASAVETIKADSDKAPCPTTGLLIRWDGQAAACCAPASHENHSHPFWIGNANVTPVAELLHRWRTNALLQTIRAWGFGPLLEWFESEQAEPGSLFRDRICDQCVAFLRDRPLTEMAAKYANRLEHRIQLGAFLLAEYDEPWMEQTLREEARIFLTSGAWPEATLQ